MKIKKSILLFVLTLLITGCTKTEFVCQKGELVDGVCKIVDVVDAEIKCPTSYEFDKTVKCFIPINFVMNATV